MSAPPSALRRPACYRSRRPLADRVLTAGLVCHRCTTVDFERPTSDDVVVEARRDALPAARSKTLEYAVHGKFRMCEGSVLSFPDTFWLTPRKLKDGGCSTADIHQARKAFEAVLRRHVRG